MKYRLASVGLVVACVALAALVSCGKSGEKETRDTEKSSKLIDISRVAQGELNMDDEIAGLSGMIEKAGFKTRTYGMFLSQQVGKKGRVLTYEDERGKRGGIIYFTMTGNTVSPCWHWYFSDMVPDSVIPVEINDDGLWDLRIASRKGAAVSLVQEESFTLLGKERDDWIALNGSASPSAPPGDVLWKAFDGDTTTAWRSTAGEGKPYIEVKAPFGVADGILTIRTLDRDRPKGCTLYADGKQLQQFDLQAKAAEQVVRLDAGVQGAKAIRLEFEPASGPRGFVAVAELGLK